MLFAAFCAAATVAVCATRAWRSERAPAVEDDLPRVAARVNGVHCLCSTDADRQSLPDPPAGPNVEDLSGPPPGPLRELPPRRCRAVALDGASELDLHIVFSETGRDDALRVTGGEPSGLTLRENGRYTLGLRDAEVDGCAEPAAVRDLLRRLREIGAGGGAAQNAFSVPEGASVRVVRTIRGAPHVAHYRNADAYWFARESFVQHSPPDASRICALLQQRLSAAAISYEFHHMSPRWPFFSYGWVHVDGWFLFEEGSVTGHRIRSGRFDPAQVRRAARWLRARGWDRSTIDGYQEQALATLFPEP